MLILAAFAPELAPFSARLRPRTHALGVGLVATTLGITASDDRAHRIAAHSGARFENLEAFGVVEACAAARVPCAVVLGVTNVVGSQASHVAIAARVARAVEETLGDFFT